jgi:hypothetical protein
MSVSAFKIAVILYIYHAPGKEKRKLQHFLPVELPLVYSCTDIILHITIMVEAKENYNFITYHYIFNYRSLVPSRA